MPICNTEAFDTVYDHNSGRGARETLHICRFAAVAQAGTGVGPYDRTRAMAARRRDMPLMPPSRSLTWAIRRTQYPVRSLAYLCETIETLRLWHFCCSARGPRVRRRRSGGYTCRARQERPAEARIDPRELRGPYVGGLCGILAACMISNVTHLQI